jgi:hypothetical protein
MTCIFGFGAHYFCPCYLLDLDVEDSQFRDIVCSSCRGKLHCQYNASIRDGNMWNGGFEEFISFAINCELHGICQSYPASCGYGLTDEQSKIVDAKFGELCDAYMTYG